MHQVRAEEPLRSCRRVQCGDERWTWNLRFVCEIPNLKSFAHLRVVYNSGAFFFGVR